MKRVGLYRGYPIAGFAKTDFPSYFEAMGVNSGNIMFKIGAQVTAGGNPSEIDDIDLNDDTIDRLNEEYDYILFAAANIINPEFSFIDYDGLRKLIARLKIPFITLSVGAQGDIDLPNDFYQSLEPPRPSRL